MYTEIIKCLLLIFLFLFECWTTALEDETGYEDEVDESCISVRLNLT